MDENLVGGDIMILTDIDNEAYVFTLHRLPLPKKMEQRMFYGFISCPSTAVTNKS